MGPQARSQKKEGQRAIPRSGDTVEGTKDVQDRNAARRAKYASDLTHKEAVKRQVRNAYRKDNPRPKVTPAKVAERAIAAGIDRELIADGMDHPVVAPSFTVPEAAAFLGRSELTFKRWIRDGLLPGPILKDTVRGYRHYSLGELQTVAKVLAVHEKEYAYLLVAHEVTKHKMWQAMQAYRALHV